MIFKKIGNMENVEAICHYFQSKRSHILDEYTRGDNSFLQEKSCIKG